MGLITGLVSTVVHVAAGRNPYGHNHNQQPVVTTAGYAPAGPSGCNHAGPGGQPCGICSVALPFGKGRQQKRERRAQRHAAKAQRFSGGRYPAYVPGGMQYQYQQQYVGGPEVYRGGSMRQEEGVWEERRRASTGADDAPPAYEEGESSRVMARRSVEVLGDGDEKHELE
ncbi:hypothetical protein COL154_007257 [Colletotrichum chrysophilum]|uniref:uncharacterized protein n=1 Tax=Colletotrichum chrysophilum TaxID=1836956 RepID=UPI00230141EA|nr:uncharacterized protein COL26b_006238 [Colletotrichum chrysophilum]KAJ0347353.1 hypothetical protein KNSL1_006562 [Colletotrichum chrysophilum]KAJ0360850.1 hypothetical protein COL154_007257 [Colletotrichum chrysophilum]KAJ0375545.1 hypothetical protein COL26b_006238 [Colletotrichum chrysophilum]